MSPKPPERSTQEQDAVPAEKDKAGTNAVEHEPDPRAEPIPAGIEPKYRPRSPYTTGND